MVTEIIRQRSRKALVEVSLGKGRVGAGTGERREAPHGPLSIHWARSSSPVLQQLPARLVRVNKPSAKVKEAYKKDIMQTVISADPAEPQIEWRNHLCSLHLPLPIWKWIAGKRCSVSPHGWLMNSIWAVRTLRHRGPGEYKNWQPAYQMAPALALACKEQSLFVNPPSRGIRFSKRRRLIDSFIVDASIALKTRFEDSGARRSAQLSALGSAGYLSGAAPRTNRTASPVRDLLSCKCQRIN